jgi:cell division septation protein DedD
MALPTDDGFHEIQLNGKQLVFLFMAATVVSVVIFLCGVLVGRGVRTERTVAQAAALNEAPPDILPSTPPSQPSAIQAGADPRIAPPPVPVDEKSTEITEDIRPDSAKAADAKAAEAKSAEAKTGGKKPSSASTPTPVEKSSKPAKAERVTKPSPEAAPAATAAAKPPAAPPAPAAPSPTPAAAAPGDGYAVQVAAVNVRTDADAIAKRFSSKGYSAYVETPPNATSVFRVRIGTFKTKREAETIAAKLQKEEQIKPWVTR